MAESKQRAKVGEEWQNSAPLHGAGAYGAGLEGWEEVQGPLVLCPCWVGASGVTIAVLAALCRSRH